LHTHTHTHTHTLLSVNGVTSAETSEKRRLRALSSAYVLSAARLVVLQLSTCEQRDVDNSAVI